MHRAFAYSEYFCRGSHRRFIINYVFSDFNRTFFNQLSQNQPSRLSFSDGN
jgi:hypothetical protein